jgi:hypothetical protein
VSQAAKDNKRVPLEGLVTDFLALQWREDHLKSHAFLGFWHVRRLLHLWAS